MQYHRPDIDNVIRRAREFGVKGIIMGSSKLEDAQILNDLSCRTENTWATIGLSPIFAETPFTEYDVMNTSDLDVTFEEKMEAIDYYFTEME